MSIGWDKFSVSPEGCTSETYAKLGRLGSDGRNDGGWGSRHNRSVKSFNDKRAPASSNWQIAIGKTNCKGFNHKGHEGTQRNIDGGAEKPESGDRACDRFVIR
jgi:hypothetical protein